MHSWATLLGVIGLAAVPTLATVTFGPRDFVISASSDSNPVKGQFTPTLAQALTAKRALLSYLQSPHRDSAKRGSSLAWSEAQRPSITAAFPTYYLQYLGIPIRWTDGSGKREVGGDPAIEIKGACEHGFFGPEEREMVGKQEMVVTDGGKCFFQADYSLTKRRIVWFSVNGQA